MWPVDTGCFTPLWNTNWRVPENEQLFIPDLDYTVCFHHIILMEFHLTFLLFVARQHCCWQIAMNSLFFCFGPETQGNVMEKQSWMWMNTSNKRAQKRGEHSEKTSDWIDKTILLKKEEKGLVDFANAWNFFSFSFNLIIIIIFYFQEFKCERYKWPPPSSTYRCV